MILKEKFDGLVPSEFGGMQEPLLSNCVEVADEFAIGFAEWIGINYFVYNTWDQSKTIKELLEIYKKTL